MAKRIVALLLAGAAVLNCCSCGKLSVADAEKMNASHPYVKEAKETSEEKGEEPAGEKNSVEPTESVIQANSNNKNQVSEIGLGETCTYNGYELTVKEVWLSNDLMLLDTLEGNAVFREFMIAQNNMGAEKKYSESGEYLKGGKQWLFIRMTLKMVQAVDENERIGLSPILYNKKSENTYSRIRLSEARGYDQYEHIDTPEIPHKDSGFHTFQEGEELDTVVAMLVPNAPGALQDVYLNTAFLTRGGSGTTSLKDGSYMVRLNIVDNQVVKE